MPRPTVRRILRSFPKIFFKIPGDTTETEAYDELGLHLYYTEGDRLDFIEAFLPSDPTFQDIHLLGRPRDVVFSQLQELGHKPAFENDGSYFCDELGIVLYVPIEEIEAASVYPKG